MFTVLVRCFGGDSGVKEPFNSVMLLPDRVIVESGDFTEYLTALYLTEISPTKRFNYFDNIYFIYKYCI